MSEKAELSADFVSASTTVPNISSTGNLNNVGIARSGMFLILKVPVHSFIVSNRKTNLLSSNFVLTKFPITACGLATKV